MDTKQKKLRIWIRIVFSLVGILIVSFIVIVLVTNKGRFSLDGINRAIAYRNLGSSEQAEKFNFDDYQLSSFAALGEGLLVASEQGYEYYVKSGKTFESKSVGMTMPSIDSSGDYALVYDIGGTTLAVLDESGVIYEITEAEAKSKAEAETEAETEAKDNGSIISAKVNGDGWSAVCRTASSVKGVVTVYNSEGTGAYEFKVGSGYPVCASVSPDCTGMYVLILTGDGSKIVRYDFSSKEEQAVYNAGNKLYMDLEYTSATTVAAVSEDDIIWLSLSGDVTASYDFTGSYLGGYEIDGGMLLFLSDYKNAGEGRLILLDSDGTVSAENDITGNVRDISFNGKYTGVLYSDRFEIYNSALDVYYDSEEIHSAGELLMRQDGTVLLISAFQATLYVP